MSSLSGTGGSTFEEEGERGRERKVRPASETEEERGRRMLGEGARERGKTLGADDGRKGARDMNGAFLESSKIRSEVRAGADSRSNALPYTLASRCYSLSLRDGRKDAPDRRDDALGKTRAYHLLHLSDACQGRERDSNEVGPLTPGLDTSPNAC